MTWGNPEAKPAAPTTPVVVLCEHPNCEGVESHAVVMIEVGTAEEPHTVAACAAHSVGFNIVGIVPGAPQIQDILERLLKQHENAKDVLNRAKNSEMELRKLVADYVIPVEDRKEGVNNVDIGGGRTAKVTHKVNYNLIGDHAKIEAAEDEASKVGNEGVFLIERIITWAPSFSKSEYNKLEEDNPTHMKVKAIVDGVLTTSDGAPVLEVKEAKAKLNG